MKPHALLIRLLGLVTLFNGLAILFSLIRPGSLAALYGYYPIGFRHLYPFLTLVVGFALTISSINILKLKRRAFLLVSLLALFSACFHVLEGRAHLQAGLSFLLLVLLVVNRKLFRVKSSAPRLRDGILRFSAAVLLAFAYGVAGFWMLDPREFGMNFHLGEAIRQTFLALTFTSGPALTPRTGYARWFLDSLHVVGAVGIGYALYAIFHPVRYRLATLPGERKTAEKILRKYGRHALDYFKIWPDKSLFFSPAKRAFLAYRVKADFAVVLADPVGPEEEIEGIVSMFREFCEENDWRFAFHQTLPDFLPVYEKLGFHKFKIGDDAIVDLPFFSLEGRQRRSLRRSVSRVEAHGIRIRQMTPPISEDDLAALKDVSDEWLTIAGKRERGFGLGAFKKGYVASTTIFAALDPGGKILGFVNLIPSYREGEITADLMRRRVSVPNGLMDYIFINLLLSLKKKGWARFNMGMAPMSGFREEEDGTAEARAIHYFFQHMNFLFSFKGLKGYKAKFATSWEPRYIVYQNPLDVALHALAIYEVSELGFQKKRRFRFPHCFFSFFRSA